MRISPHIQIKIYMSRKTPFTDYVEKRMSESDNFKKAFEEAKQEITQKDLEKKVQQEARGFGNKISFSKEFLENFHKEQERARKKKK